MPRRSKLWLCLAAAVMLGLSAAGAEAQVRKSCRPIENERMICTEITSPRAAAPVRPAPTPAAAPPWKAVVARAILDGRCAEARRVALENGDLEAAQQAASLCVAR